MSAVLGMLALSLCSGLTAAWFGNRGGEADHAQKPPAPAATNGLTIPKDHPRIWWSPERLEQGRRWLAKTHLQPRADNVWDNALCYVLTRQKAYARPVITAMLAYQIPEERLRQESVDLYRWNDWFPVVFDWTYGAMTPDERQKPIEKYKGYVDGIRNKPWGGPKMPASNYYWGYFRNELNWAIATYHENPMAQTFLEHALSTRWQDSFLPFAAEQAKGGVPAEGTQYGRYMLQYPVVPFTTVRRLGRDLFRETHFYKEATLWLIYATTPGAQGGCGQAYLSVVSL
ncbi:MAG: hypothetical protein E6K70_22630 [Planctomycetota bacterium]|nr:MAG: hypothetical protein E6K70_22630 [Planctomycetota bacterium]